MRRNYKSKFNELTPIGWVVAGGIVVVIIGIAIVVALVVRSF